VILSWQTVQLQQFTEDIECFGAAGLTWIDSLWALCAVQPKKLNIQHGVRLHSRCSGSENKCSCCNNLCFRAKGIDDSVYVAKLQ